MDHLKLDRAFVVGVAYGARTAAQFGLRHPRRLSGLGLFDVALTPPVDQVDQGALGAQATAMLKESGIDVPERQKYWRFYGDRDAARKCHTAHEREPDTTSMIHAITAPTLVACGEQDMNLPAAEHIASQIPGALFSPMPMTGHGSPFFRPDLFAQLIRNFTLSLAPADWAVISQWSTNHRVADTAGDRAVAPLFPAKTHTDWAASNSRPTRAGRGARLYVGGGEFLIAASSAVRSAMGWL